MPAFGNVITLPKAGNFYNGDLWGNSLPVVGFEWNLAPVKPSNDWGEFELDRARSKNNIAKNSVALGYETHNRLNRWSLYMFVLINCIIFQPNVIQIIVKSCNVENFMVCTNSCFYFVFSSRCNVIYIYTYTSHVTPQKKLFSFCIHVFMQNCNLTQKKIFIILSPNCFSHDTKKKYKWILLVCSLAL